MKFIQGLILVFSFLNLFGNEAIAQEVKVDMSNKKVLVVYFSKTGNTKYVANLIKEKTNADIFEVKAIREYSDDYYTLTEEAKEELNKNARPELVNKISNIDDYDIVFIGTPSWWGTMPMPMFTFIDSYDFSNKIIIPFVTHEGSGLGRNASDIKSLAPNAKLLKDLAIRGSSVRTSSAEGDITEWLSGLGF